MPLIPWQAQDTNHLLGKPVPALTTLRVKKCFPMHSLILPWQCCAILTCPAMGSRSTARCLSVSPPQGIAGSTEITSSNWTAQVPSAPPRRTCLPALLPALLPSLDAFKGLNILFFFFLCCGDRRCTWYSRWGCTNTKCNESVNWEWENSSMDLFCLCATACNSLNS